MIKYFRLEIDGENAFGNRERDIHTTIVPSMLHKVLQTEGVAALSSSGASGGQSFPEPEDGVWLVTGASGNNISLAYSRTNLAKAVPSSQVGSFGAFMNEFDITRAPLLPSSSL